MPGYEECVTKVWSTLIQSPQNAMLNLHIKLARTSKAMSSWAKQLIPLGKLTVAICHEIIAQLDNAQENMMLSTKEL
jgi:hypothetical protein